MKKQIVIRKIKILEYSDLCDELIGQIFDAKLMPEKEWGDGVYEIVLPDKKKTTLTLYEGDYELVD